MSTVPSPFLPWRCTSLDVPEVLLIAMSLHLGLLHAHLRGYKDDRDAGVRARMALRLAALVSVFMTNHERCLGGWDYVTSVPSARRVAPAAIVSRLRVFEHSYKQVLVASTDVHRSERLLDPGRFAVSGAVRRDRVLLFDDTFTSGADIFSAVAALREAGADVVGPLVIGRHIRRDWAPSQALLDWLARRKWDQRRCAHCGGEYPTLSGLRLERCFDDNVHREMPNDVGYAVVWRITIEVDRVPQPVKSYRVEGCRLEPSDWLQPTASRLSSQCSNHLQRASSCLTNRSVRVVQQQVEQFQTITVAP